MDAHSTGAAPRVPFRRGSTPSFPPQRPSLDVPPLDSIYASLASQPSGDYPESPTRSHARGRTGGKQPERELSLNDDDEPEEKRKGPKRTWSARRSIVYLVMLGGIGLAARSFFTKEKGLEGLETILKEGKQQIQALYREPDDDGWCRFVSPVEAYHRDLKRLRQKVADQYRFDLVYPSNFNHTARSHHHKFSNTGHLLISDAPGSPHPIPLLLSLGEKRWEELLRRQSRTLGEAVREYKRRYSRNPPKGFDIWWQKAQEYSLVLPDEYDRINLDLAPFFALPKEEMKRRMLMVEDMKETFTIVVRKGVVYVRVSTALAYDVRTVWLITQIKDKGGLKWGGTKPRAQDASRYATCQKAR